MEFRTLKQIFTHSVKKYAKNTALSMFERESMTYGEMGERVAYVSNMLVEAGLSAGDKVALLSSSMPNWGVCYFAAVNAGMVIGVADDAGMHSSQNEQDSRHHALAAKLPMLEPSDSA